jgi:hypothetical protein
MKMASGREHKLSDEEIGNCGRILMPAGSRDSTDEQAFE